jgi:pyruvate/2-oxoglutarate dehydrogenase complex dihydrolipoamide acyltransferase (E2) component
MPTLYIPGPYNQRCALLNDMVIAPGGYVPAAQAILNDYEVKSQNGKVTFTSPGELIVYLSKKAYDAQCGVDIARAQEQLLAAGRPAAAAAAGAAAAGAAPADVAAAAAVAGAAPAAAAAAGAAAAAAADADLGMFPAQNPDTLHHLAQIKIGKCQYRVCMDAAGKRVLCSLNKYASSVTKYRKCAAAKKRSSSKKRRGYSSKKRSSSRKARKSGGRRRKSVKRGSYRRPRSQRRCRSGFRRSRSGKTCLKR